MFGLHEGACLPVSVVESLDEVSKDSRVGEFPEVLAVLSSLLSVLVSFSP